MEDHRKTIGNELENYSKSKKTIGIRWKTIVIRLKRIGKNLGTNKSEKNSSEKSKECFDHLMRI